MHSTGRQTARATKHVTFAQAEKGLPLLIEKIGKVAWLSRICIKPMTHGFVLQVRVRRGVRVPIEPPFTIGRHAIPAKITLDDETIVPVRVRSDPAS